MPTVRERLGEWQKARSSAWSVRYATEVKRLADKIIIPALGARPLSETRREDWAQLAAGLRAKAPATATWIYTLASSFLTHAEAMGWIVANPLPRRGKGLIAPPVEARARAPSDDELVRIWQAAAGLTSKSRAFARLLIMTAARVSEVAGISAGEVNVLTGRWLLPGERAKNRNPLTIPLHPLLVAELRAIWPKGAAAAGFKLLGAVRGSGLQAPSAIKRRLDQLSGVKGWRWHDLRRSARSGMARLGVDARAAEAALNHVSDRSQLERTYDRYDYASEALAALQTWQAHVAGLIAAPATTAA